MKKLSELYPTEAFPELEKVSVDDILGKEIVVHEIVEMSGKNGEYITARFTEGESEDYKKFSSGGVVILDRLRRAAKDDNLPILCTISKDKEYYTVS